MAIICGFAGSLQSSLTTPAGHEALGDGQQARIHVGHLAVAKEPSAMGVLKRRGHPA